MRNKAHRTLLIWIGILLLLSSCNSNFSDGAILVETTRVPARLTIVDIQRQSHKGELLGITEEEWLASGQAGDYLKITFQLENPEDGGYMHFMGSMLAVSWGDNYARPELTACPFTLKPEPGNVEEFSCLFKLADQGYLSAIESPDDINLIYDHDLITPGKPSLERILKNANLSVPLSKLWAGSFD